MVEKDFLKAMTVVKEGFPRYPFNPVLYWQVLKDLDGECLIKAAEDTVKTVEQLYNDSNLLAILRNRSISLKKQKLEEMDNRKLSDDRSDPPPPAWEEMKKKIGRRV